MLTFFKFWLSFKKIELGKKYIHENDLNKSLEDDRLIYIPTSFTDCSVKYDYYLKSNNNLIRKGITTKRAFRAFFHRI